MSDRPARSGAYERDYCPVCGRVVCLKEPRGGDGSLLVAFRHLNEQGNECLGSDQPADWLGE